MPRTLYLMLLVLSALLASSCIDGREELWINADGSGRAELRYRIPKAADALRSPERIDRAVGDFLARNARIFPHRSHQIEPLADGIDIRVAVSFDSVADLATLDVSGADVPPVVRHLAGTIELVRDGRTVDFTRVVSPGRGLPGWRFMPRAPFEKRRLVYIMHLPAPAKISNASRIEDGGRTHIWDLPLTSALQQPVTLNIRAKIPIPWWIVAIAITALTGIASAIVWARSRTRRSKSSTASTHTAAQHQTGENR